MFERDLSKRKFHQFIFISISTCYFTYFKTFFIVVVYQIEFCMCLCVYVIALIKISILWANVIIPMHLIQTHTYPAIKSNAWNFFRSIDGRHSLQTACQNNDQLFFFFSSPHFVALSLLRRSFSFGAWDDDGVSYISISITSMKRNRKQIKLLLWHCHCLAFLLLCSLKHADNIFLNDFVRNMATSERWEAGGGILCDVNNN